MKNSILLSLLILNSELIIAQKLPIYAIRTQYQIDGIRDTLGPKAGGVVLPGSTVIRDSVLFHYISKGQLEREQVFRTEIINNVDGTIFASYPPDSSYYFRQHRYDSLGRKVSLRHYYIYEYRSSLDYGKIYLMRIDSIAYDSHGSQLFNRRYEPYDFDRGNLTMVVKNPSEDKYVEHEYDYDNLGRVYKMRRYYWSVANNIANRVPIGYDGVNPIEFTYFYQGNTNKIRVRRYNWYYTSGPGVYASRDSLFRYDAKGRMVRFNRYPNVVRFQPVSYQQIYGIDSTYYYDNNNSYQKGSNRGTNESTSCDGVAFDSLGRLKYSFRNKFQMQLDDIPSSYLCGNETFTVTGQVKHYVDSPDGTLLAQDSIYQEVVWGSRYCESTCYSYLAFDTISYHGFVDAPLAIENSYKMQVENSDFVVYPNPAQDVFTFQCDKIGGNLILYSLYGIKKMNVHIKNTNQNIDFSQITKGVYLLVYQGRTKKLIKQ